MKNWKIISHCHDWSNIEQILWREILFAFFKCLSGNQPQFHGFSQPTDNCFNPKCPSPTREPSSNLSAFCCTSTNKSLLQELQNTAQFHPNEKHPAVLIFSWIITGQKVTWKFRIWTEMLNYYFICNQCSLEYILTFLCFGRWLIKLVVIYPLLQRHVILRDVVLLWGT